MPLFDYRSLGSTGMSWIEAKSSDGITLLQAAHPSGGPAYRVVSDYTSAYEQQLYPTEARLATDKSNEVERDPETAYTRFNEIVAAQVGISKTSEGIEPQLGKSFEDFDESLLGQSTFSPDLIRELQRTGRNAYGAPKTALNLGYPSGLTPMFSRNQEHERMARLRYASYPIETRKKALRDISEQMMAAHMDGSVVSQIIAANREMRTRYAESDYDGSLENYADDPSKPLIPDTPVASFDVRFIDQNGEEIRSLPYELAIRGSVNLRKAWASTNGGKDPGSFPSGRMLREKWDRAISGEHLPQHAIDRGYHMLYPYKTDGESPVRGTVTVAVFVPQGSTPNDWQNPRLKGYSGSPSTANDRERNTVTATTGTVLLQQAFRIDGSRMAFTVRVPVYREPIPMHLVEDPNSPSGFASVWSTTPKVEELPHHQKVTLNLEGRIWNPGTIDSEGAVIPATWEQAPRGSTLRLQPYADNAWLASRVSVPLTASYSGRFAADLAPGRYELIYSHDEEEINLGSIEVPAAYYYRRPDANDTTPIGMVGTNLLSSADAGHYDNFRLAQAVPSLPEGITPEAGSIFHNLIHTHPNIAAGWPTSSDYTSNEHIFDTAVIKLPPNQEADDMVEEQAQESGYEPLTLNERTAVYVTNPSTGEPTSLRVFVERVRFNNEKNPYLSVAFDGSPGPGSGNTGVTTNIELHRIATPSSNGIEAIVWYPENAILRASTNLTWQVGVGDSDLEPFRHATVGMQSSPEAAMLMGMRVILDQTVSVADAYDIAIENAHAGAMGLPINDAIGGVTDDYRSQGSGYKRHFTTATVTGLTNSSVAESSFPGIGIYADGTYSLGGTANIEVETGQLAGDILYAPPVVPDEGHPMGFMESVE